MTAKTDIGLPENLLYPEATNAEDVEYLVFAVARLHELLSRVTGDLSVHGLNYTDFVVSSTVNSQNSDKVYCKSLDNGQLGNLVTFQPDGNCSKASTLAHGFISEIIDSSAGVVAVSFGGLADFFSGLVVGTDYYLGANGSLTQTVTAQRVGFAISPTAVYIRIS